jgi:hypothetical protein
MVRFDNRQALLSSPIDPKQCAVLCIVGGGRDVATSSSPVDVNIFTFWVLFVRILRLDEESVSTKIITLCLEKIGREILGAVTVVPAERGTESGKWDTPHCTFADNIPPARLRLVDGLIEEIVEEQIFEIWVVTIGLRDILQED